MERCCSLGGSTLECCQGGCCVLADCKSVKRREVMTPYKIIDGGAHMCEPPNLWVERIDGRFRDRAPRVVKDPGGRKGAFFVCENLPPLNVAGAFAAGKTFDKGCMEAGLGNALPGGWDPAARLEDIELARVEAAVQYSTEGSGRFGREGAEVQEACCPACKD